jgi:hypothetical protein
LGIEFPELFGLCKDTIRTEETSGRTLYYDKQRDDIPVKPIYINKHLMMEKGAVPVKNHNRLYRSTARRAKSTSNKETVTLSPTKQQ